jgi:hypothetical protein
MSDAEQTLLSEFKRRAHTYLAAQEIPANDDTGEWLALMQHFGAPTRLLDVTRSPYVASYFAVENAVEDCAVWAVEKFWCLDAAGKVVLQRQPDRRGQIEAIRRLAGLVSPATLIQGIDSSLLHGDLWRKNVMKLVVPFTPERLSERLSIQQGEFLVPRDVDAPFLDNLAALGDASRHVVKYVIPVDMHSRTLERLRIMNISRAQLFPGLDGFAQSFRQLLRTESKEEQARRMVIRGLIEAMQGQKRK